MFPEAQPPRPLPRRALGLGARRAGEFGSGREMPRGLRVLAGNAARGAGSRHCPGRCRDRPGGWGPGGTGYLLRRSRRRQDKRGAASGAGPLPNSRRGSPVPELRSLPRRRLPGRAPSPGLPAGCPGRPQVCGARARPAPPWCEPPQGAGAPGGGSVPAPPRGCAGRRALSQAAGLAFLRTGRRGGAALPVPCPCPARVPPPGSERRVPAPGGGGPGQGRPHGPAPAPRGRGRQRLCRGNRASLMGGTFRAK